MIFFMLTFIPFDLLLIIFAAEDGIALFFLFQVKFLALFNFSIVFLFLLFCCFFVLY